MPWTTLLRAKKAGAITNFRKKPISLAAINKLYDIYDAIKAKEKPNVTPMAAAMSTWKGLVVLKNETWVLKPKKESKKERKEQVETTPLPVSVGRFGDGSYESFKDSLRNAVKEIFGDVKKYVYIVATYRTKVVIHVEKERLQDFYYEVPYKVKNNQFEFGTPVKVVKMTKFQKAEQKNWHEYKESVRAFVNGNGTVADVVGLGVKASREALWTGDR